MPRRRRSSTRRTARPSGGDAARRSSADSPWEAGIDCRGGRRQAKLGKRAPTRPPGGGENLVPFLAVRWNPLIDPSRWWSPLFPVLRLLSGPLLSALVAAILSWYGHAFPVLVAAGVVMWCAAWWVLEPVPIAVTALIPLGVFPATGVLTSSQVAESVGHRLVLLFMGGLMLSMAMERSGAHRRIALAMVRLFGGQQAEGANPRRIVFGFMTAAAILSMWISNGATTLMMLPIALAVVEQTDSKKFPV